MAGLDAQPDITAAQNRPQTGQQALFCLKFIRYLLIDGSLRVKGVGNVLLLLGQSQCHLLLFGIPGALHTRLADLDAKN